MDRIKVPQLATPPHLGAGCVLLTGGRDLRGRPIACFPPRSLMQLQISAITSADIVAIVEYFIGTTPPDMRMSGLAFVADFRACSQSAFRVIIDALTLLQRQNHGSVAVLYVVAPRAKELLKSLQKLLGLYQKRGFFSRRQAAVASKPFESVLVSNAQELLQFATRDQLLADFGGSLNYDHQAWMQLRAAFDELLTRVNTITETVPLAQERLELLKQFEQPEDEEECQEMVRWMQNKFQEVMRELQLEELSQQATKLMEACQHPERSAELLLLTKNPLLLPYADRLSRLDTKLKEMRHLLRKKWKEAENRLIFSGQLYIYRKIADPIVEWMDRSVLQLRQLNLKTISSKQMAEDAQEKLRLEIRDPAKTKLSEAQEVLRKVRKVAMSVTDPADQAQLEPSLYASQLEAKLSNFSNRLQRVTDALDKLCRFFTNTSEALRWYRRCAQRLPFDLLLHHQRMQPHEELTFTDRWAEAAKNFLEQYQCPRDGKIQEIRDGLPLIDNSEIRNETQLLLYRVGMLSNLVNRHSISVRDFRELLTWREREISPHQVPEITTLETSPSIISSSDHGQEDAAVDFDAELRDLEDSISEHSYKFCLKQQLLEQADNRSSGTASSGAQRYKKKDKKRSTVHEYRPQSNLGVEIDEEFHYPNPKELTRSKEAAKPSYSSPQVSLESQPKEETVWKFLENMVSPKSSDSFAASLQIEDRESLNHPQSANTTSSSLGYPFGRSEFAARKAAPKAANSARTLSSKGRSLTDLVGELKEIGDALFGSKQPNQSARAPASRGKISRKKDQQQAGSLLPRSQSVENLFFSPEGEQMHRVTDPRFFSTNPNYQDWSSSLPYRATSEHLILDESSLGEEEQGDEEFELLVPPKKTKAKSDSGLSAVSVLDSTLNNWRNERQRERQDKEKQERDMRRQELLQEAEKNLAASEDYQSDSGLSDQTLPQSVMDFRSRAARRRISRPNADSGKPSSDTDDIEQVISDIHDITGSRHPYGASSRNPRLHNERTGELADPLYSLQSRARALSDYEGRSLTPDLQPREQMSRMSDMDLTTYPEANQTLKPSRYSDNFLLAPDSSSAVARVHTAERNSSGGRSHSPLFISPPPSIPEEAGRKDDDSSTMYTGKTPKSARQILNVRRYNRDTPNAINPLTGGATDEKMREAYPIPDTRIQHQRQSDEPQSSVFY